MDTQTLSLPAPLATTHAALSPVWRAWRWALPSSVLIAGGVASIRGGGVGSTLAEAADTYWILAIALTGLALIWQICAGRNRLLSPRSTAVLRWSRSAGTANAIAFLIALGAGLAALPRAQEAPWHIVVDLALVAAGGSLLSIVAYRVRIARRIHAVRRKHFERSSPRKR